MQQILPNSIASCSRHLWLTYVHCAVVSQLCRYTRKPRDDVSTPAHAPQTEHCGLEFSLAVVYMPLPCQCIALLCDAHC